MSGSNTTLTVSLVADPSRLKEGLAGGTAATQAFATEAQRAIDRTAKSFEKFSIGGKEIEGAFTRARAEGLRLIELQHQLTVAEAAGSKARAQELRDEIALLQQIRTLRSRGLSQEDASAAARGSFAAVAAAREAAEQREVAAKRRERTIGNPGEAIASAFGRVRLGVLEEGSTKLPVFGSSLEALGTAGLGTAAALAAVAVAGEEARKSLEFADEIDRTAKSLGVSTTELQEFDHATVLASVGVAKGRENLAAFNEVIGKYSSGLASAKQGKFLAAIGITPADARDLDSTQEALEKTLTALAKVQNPQQRASIATQLGLKDFLVVLAEGQEGVEKFFATMRSAQGAGAVISPDEIKRAAEMNDRLEQVEHTVGVELRKAFLELGPAVLAVAELVERVAGGAAKLANSITNILSGIGALQNDADRQANRDFFRDVGRAGSYLLHNTSVGQGFLALRDGAHNLAQDGRAARLRGGVEEALSGRVDFSAYGLGERPKGVDLSQPKKERTVEDQTANFDKAAIDAYQSALKAAATATAALTGDIEKRAELEKQAVDDDLTKKLADLSKQEGDIRKAKLDTHRREQLALIEKARTEEQNAAAAKKEKIDRDAAAALRERELQQATTEADLDARLATARASVRPGNDRRRDVELQNFKTRQELQDRQQQDELQTQAEAGQITPEKAAELLAKGRATRSAELIAQRSSAFQTDPLYNLGHPLTSLTDDLHGAEAQGVKAIGDNLRDVATGAKNAETAFHDMALSIVADLAEIAIKREIEGPLASLLFGGQAGNLFATSGSAAVGPLGHNALGTDNWRGGASVVGEHGPELVNLPRGAQVIPNTVLSSLTRMGVPSAAQPVSIYSPSFDFRGAVTTQDLIDHANATAKREAQIARAQAGQDARNALPAAMRSYQQLGTT